MLREVFLTWLHWVNIDSSKRFSRAAQSFDRNEDMFPNEGMTTLPGVPDKMKKKDLNKRNKVCIVKKN